MNPVNMAIRELEDMKIAAECQICCMCCEKYKMVKDQNKFCKVRKARGRMVQREVRAYHKELTTSSQAT